MLLPEPLFSRCPALCSQRGPAVPLLMMLESSRRSYTPVGLLVMTVPGSSVTMPLLWIPDPLTTSVRGPRKTEPPMTNVPSNEFVPAPVAEPPFQMKWPLCVSRPGPLYTPRVWRNVAMRDVTVLVRMIVPVLKLSN